MPKHLCDLTPLAPTGHSLDRYSLARGVEEERENRRQKLARERRVALEGD